MHDFIGGPQLLCRWPVQGPEWFRLRLQAEELTRRRPTSDFDSMESLESSRDTRLLPHQIHAAHFAVSNPLLKGVAFFVLEVSTGYLFMEKKVEAAGMANIAISLYSILDAYREAKGAPLFPSQEADRFLVCKVCGKELKHWWSFMFRRQDKPDWVTK